MRVLIVGAGVVGLLTAMECLADGHEVVVLDSGDIPNPAATSYDRHRTLRALHQNDPAATAAAVRAHHRWIELQHVLGTRFYEQVGSLTVMPPADLDRARALLSAAGSQAHALDPDELTARYPHVEFPIGEGAVFESHAGVLLADRFLLACADWLGRQPAADLRPHQQVTAIDADRALVHLADGGTVGADAILAAPGPWSRDLLPTLAGDLQLYQQAVLFCDVPDLDASAWAATPPMLSIGVDGCAWLVPPVVGTPLKLSAASACRTADRVGGGVADPYWRQHLIDVFSEVIPGFRADWVVDAQDCCYMARASTDGAMTAMLGERVVAFAACGGSSFKFAPVIAQALTASLTDAPAAPCGLRAVDSALVRRPRPTLADHRHVRPAIRGMR